MCFLARRAQVKRAQDEAKSEIEAYRRTLEEDFKKKQDEVCTPVWHYTQCHFGLDGVGDVRGRALRRPCPHGLLLGPQHFFGSPTWA